MQTRAEKYRETLDHLPINGESPRGFVQVQRNDRGEVTVTVRRGTFAQLTEAELAREIHGGLDAALQEYARKGRELRRQFFVASAEFLEPDAAGRSDTVDNGGNNRG
jgi:hypothetical protein